MHDALSAAYELHRVMDDPDEPTTIAISRVSTEDLTMQINVMGLWHRRTPDLKTTACGVPFHSQFSPSRREELCGVMCPECFTAHELRLADETNRKEHE